MPAASIMAFAKKTGTSTERVEHLWKKAKEQASNKKSKSDPDFYAYTVGILKKMLGIHEEILGGVPVGDLEDLEEQAAGGGGGGAGGATGAGSATGASAGAQTGGTDSKTGAQSSTQSSATTSKDYPVVPVAGAQADRKELMRRVRPDCVVHGLDCFNVTKEDFIGMAKARQNGQRYPIKDNRVRQYMRENNYRRPFALQHDGNIIKIGKPVAK